MKKLLSILGTIGIVASGSSSIMAMSPANTTVKNEIQSVYAGTKASNVSIEQEISDVNMGGAKQAEAPASHNYEWSDFQIDKTIVPKMDYTKSWIKLNVKYWYSDNSGKGNSDSFAPREDIIVTRSNFDTGVKEYNDDRHHEGGRQTDHQWKWQVKVNQEGVYLWDWVWVWANGNWGNKAVSKAGIIIESFDHFEFLV